MVCDYARVLDGTGVKIESNRFIKLATKDKTYIRLRKKANRYKVSIELGRGRCA